MKYIYSLIDNLIKKFNKENLKDAPSYFDYSSRERKEIIKKAAKDSNKMQRQLEEEYNRLYPQFN